MTWVRAFQLGLTGLLIAIATWGVVDLALDHPEHRLSAHVLVEIGSVLLSLGSVFYLWLGGGAGSTQPGSGEGSLGCQ